MTNLFAFRATKPADMKAAADPVGPQNDRHLRRVAKRAGVVVAAWGAHGRYLGRDLKVFAILRSLHYLKFTKRGLPRHPLYLPKGLEPIAWRRLHS